jgi:hypothetical protein
MAAGLTEYLKRAFLYRWNMLLFTGGAVASVLSPWPDAMLALVAAGELVYLTQLVSSTRFREAIDAAVHKETKDTAAASGQRTIQQLITGLSTESKRRFEALRARCLDMRAIAMGVRGRTSAEHGEDISTSHLRARSPAVGLPAVARFRRGAPSVPTAHRRKRDQHAFRRSQGAARGAERYR